MNDDAEGDSVDSLICACGSSMLMTFFYANAMRLRERTKSRGRSGEEGVDPER